MGEGNHTHTHTYIHESTCALTVKLRRHRNAQIDTRKHSEETRGTDNRPGIKNRTQKHRYGLLERHKTRPDTEQYTQTWTHTHDTNGDLYIRYGHDTAGGERETHTHTHYEGACTYTDLPRVRRVHH